MAGKTLTPKERLFVAEFLVDRNGAAAARRAGYAAKSARVTAARLLAKANVRAAIEDGANRAIERARVTAEWLTKKYQAVHDGAMAAKQFTAACKALDSLAKLVGHQPGQRLVHRGDPASPVKLEHGGNVTHEHRFTPDTLRGFAADLVAAGLAPPGGGDLPRDGDTQPVDQRGP